MTLALAVRDNDARTAEAARAEAVGALVAAGLLRPTMAALRAAAAAVGVSMGAVEAAVERAAEDLATSRADKPRLALRHLPVPDMRSVRTATSLVAEMSGYSVEDLRGESRERPLVRWRQVAMAVAYEAGEGNISYPALGRWFCRDHTTIMHGTQRAMGDADTAALVAELVGLVREWVEAGEG